MIERIGPFQCTESLGGGATGQVYRAIEQMEGGITRTVALKVLPAMSGDDAAARERFFDEARSIISLSSSAGRHIVQCYSCGIEAQTRRPWISMQLIRRTVEEMIGTEPSDADITRRLLVEVLLGLHAMHSLKPALIHNDLKPGNLLADDLDNFLIADFGVARRLSDKATLPAFSARYAAPEIHQAGSGTPGSDLYSLGHIVYEFALGKRLFEHEFRSIFAGETEPQSVRAWRDWHLSSSHSARPLDVVLPGSDPALARIVERLMAKEPAKRYTSAALVLADLGVRTPDMPVPTVVRPDEGHADRQRHSFPAGPAAPSPVWKDEVRAAPETFPPRRNDADKKRKTTALMIAFIAICTGCALAVSLIDFSPAPVIRLTGGPEFVRSDSHFEVGGTVESMPAGATLECVVGNQSPIVAATKVGEKGTRTFTAAPRIAAIGAVKGNVRVLQDGKVRATAAFTLKREPPKEVLVQFQTTPPVEGVKIATVGTAAGAISTDANGAASLKVPFGTFSYRVEHAAYRAVASAAAIETGIEPSLSLLVPVEKSAFETRLLFAPGTDRATVVDAKGNETPLQLVAGPITKTFADGPYTCRFGNSQDGTSFEKPFQVTRDGDNSFVFGPPLESVVPEKRFGVKGDRWAGLDAQKVALMSDADFLKYLKENVPLATINVREPRPGMKQVRIEGSVLNDTDLERLTDRLKPASTRVIIDVAVNADFVAAQYVESLRSGGVKEAQVTCVGVSRGEKQAETHWRLKIDFTETDGFDVASVREIGRAYTLDDANLDVRRPYASSAKKR